MTKHSTFKEGEVVFAKVKGYPPWPAKVIATGSGKYPVLFFGTNESANCKAQDVFAFADFREKYGKNSKPAFLKAMNEAISALEGGGNDEETEEGPSKRSRRSDTGTKAKPASTKEESEEEKSEEEEGEEEKAAKKRAKPAPKSKKVSVAKKSPARRTTHKSSKSESESEDDVPLSKAASAKTDQPAATGGRGGRRRGTKAISYVDKDSDDDSDKEEAKKPSKSKRKVKNSDSEASQSGSASESDKSEKDSSSDGSDNEALSKSANNVIATRRRTPAKKAAAKSETKAKRKPPARKGRAAKQTVEPSGSESEGKDESDKDSVKSSESKSSSKSSSSSSSSSSAGSSKPSKHSDDESDKETEAKVQTTEQTKDTKDEVDEAVGEEKAEGEVEEKAEGKVEEKADTSGESEGLALSKEHVTDIPEADEGKGVEEEVESSRESATNSSVEDDEVIHSSRAHKSHSKHAVLSESDTDNEDGKPKEEQKDLEQMLAERKKEHLELKMKRRQEKMEERRLRQIEKEKEQEEERKQKEEKKKQHQQRVRTEKKIRELDDVIKRSLAVSTKDIPRCVEAMKELDILEIGAAMLVKYPAIIDTLKKCRKYKADKDVMREAEALCNKLRMIATSDKSALTALNKQKSERHKTKREDHVEEKGDIKVVMSVEVKSDTPVDGAITTDDVKDEISADVKTEITAPLTTSIMQSDNANTPTTEITHDINMEVDNDNNSQVLVTTTDTADTQTEGDHTTSIAGVAKSSAKDTTDSTNNTSLRDTDIPTSHVMSSDDLPEVYLSPDESLSKPPTPPPVVGSVSDLKVMAKDELPSEDALTAGIQALIAKTQESSAMLDQVIKQKKDKRLSSSSNRKRRKLDSGLHHHESTRSSSQIHKHSSSASSKPLVTTHKTVSPTKPAERESKPTARKATELDDLDIHDLLGI